MRKDMSKVVVERPRHGRSRPARAGRTRALLDDEGAPLRASMREPVKAPAKTKYFSDHLGPLRRFLLKNVGRPWNKVYGEISAELKPTSVVQQHVRDHVHDFVAIHARTRAGVMHVVSRWGREQPLAEDYRPLYVHPRTGLLRRNEAYKNWGKRARERAQAEAAERAGRMCELSPKLQLHKLKDDVWWEVKLARAGDGRLPDVVIAAGLSDLAPEKLYGRADVRAMDKRVLSKAEKKKLGLD